MVSAGGVCPARVRIICPRVISSRWGAPGVPRHAEIHPVVFERFKIQNAIAFRPDAILLTGVVTVDDGHSYGEAHDQGRFLPLHPEQGNVLKKLDRPDFYQALGRYLNDWNRPS